MLLRWHLLPLIRFIFLQATCIFLWQDFHDMAQVFVCSACLSNLKISIWTPINVSILDVSVPFISMWLFTICFTVYVYNFSLQYSDLQLGVIVSIMVSEAQNNVHNSCSSCVIYSPSCDRNKCICPTHRPCLIIKWSTFYRYELGQNSHPVFRQIWLLCNLPDAHRTTRPHHCHKIVYGMIHKLC
jgi:hypothetical protein